MAALLFVTVGTLMSVVLGLAAALYLTVAYIGLGVRIVVQTAATQLASVVHPHHGAA